MLVLHARGGQIREPPSDLPRGNLPDDVVWLDLLKPSPVECSFVERTTGLRVPSFEDLAEIETSSRLRSERGALYLSAPLVYRATASNPGTTPVGFVLGPERMLTVRFESLTAFADFGPEDGGAPEAFAGLIEAIVDRLADVLEQIADE